MMMVSLENGFKSSDIHAMQHADNLILNFSFALQNKCYLQDFVQMISHKYILVNPIKQPILQTCCSNLQACISVVNNRTDFDM